MKYSCSEFVAGISFTVVPGMLFAAIDGFSHKKCYPKGMHIAGIEGVGHSRGFF